MALDPRVTHHTAHVHGRTYHYLLGVPQDQKYQATIFLIHGWPDLSYGWRNQLSFLLDRQLRVVVPDVMGYGGTDAPQVPPESLYLYGHKRAADDIKELARQLEAPKIILGGHDWGGSIVFRVALWHPDLVTHIFSVCTPYFPPTKDWVSLDDLVKRLPSLRYQVHLAGPEIEAHVKSKTEIKQFLNAMFGGRGPNGEVGFNTAEGIALDVLPKLGKTPLLSEQELDHYVEEYAKHGMHGPLNWYRTRQQNYEDELELSNSTISQPVLFISAARDAALPPALAQGMDHFIPHLTKKQVEAGHWALVQAAKHVNAFVGEWLSQVGFAEEGGGKSTL